MLQCNMQQLFECCAAEKTNVLLFFHIIVDLNGEEKNKIVV